jgi:hypothetical protein
MEQQSRLRSLALLTKLFNKLKNLDILIHADPQSNMAKAGGETMGEEQLPQYI